MLGHGLEHQVDGAVAIDEPIDLPGTRNVNGTLAAPSVATKHMLAGFAHHGAIAHIVYALGGQQWHLVALATGSDGRSSMVSIFSSERSTVAATSSVSSKSSAGSSDSTAEDDDGTRRAGRLDGHAHRACPPRRISRSEQRSTASNRLTLPTERPGTASDTVSIENSSAGT